MNLQLINLILFVSAFHLSVFISPQGQIIGQWLSPHMKNATIRIYQSNDGFIYGKIIDCDRKEWIGEIVLNKIQYDDSNDEWTGEIFSLERNMSINVRIFLTDDGKLKLVGSKLLFTKTYYWRKL